MKGRLVVGEVGAGPRVSAEMETVLMTLGFVFVLETVVAVLTRVWFAHSVHSVNFTLVSRDDKTDLNLAMTHSSSSSLSNLFGFFGQHSQMKTP